jgi:hypothetical protein
MACAQVVLRCNPRGNISQGAGPRRAAAWRPPTESAPEPASPETVGNIPMGLTWRPMTRGHTKNPGTSMETDKTSVRRRTCRSPMLAHGTSPISGASVVGMTYGACHVPSYLPAGVPGVSTAGRQEDRLRPEGRLCQQPAGDSAVEGRSRAMKTKAHQRLSRRKWADPDKSDRGQGRE